MIQQFLDTTFKNLAVYRINERELARVHGYSYAMRTDKRPDCFKLLLEVALPVKLIDGVLRICDR
jgi:hypothetical protein